MAEIKIVTIDELRQMNDQEGLILQGCGGDLQEWVEMCIRDSCKDVALCDMHNTFG